MDCMTFDWRLGNRQRTGFDPIHHQGAAIGGVAPAAWVFVAENAPVRRQGLAVGLLTSGLSCGILLGSLTSDSLSAVRR
jgi:MFS family permease